MKTSIQSPKYVVQRLRDLAEGDYFVRYYGGQGFGSQPIVYQVPSVAATATLRCLKPPKGRELVIRVSQSFDDNEQNSGIDTGQILFMDSNVDVVEVRQVGNPEIEFLPVVDVEP